MKKFVHASKGMVLAALVATTLYGCGGGGGGSSGTASGTTSGTSSTTTSTTATTVTNYFVDGPTKGINYSCSPSGDVGVTDASGSFTCQSGDTATFTLNVAGGSITLGSFNVPSTNGVSIPVTVFSNGLQVAEILQALNHGTSTDIDVSGLTIPAAVIAQINTYISSAGANLGGQASDDQFLTYLQSQATGAGTYTTHVTGTGTTFRMNTVLPNLQTTVAAISATNPPAPAKNGVTTLSGSILVTGNSTIVVPNCQGGASSITGGGILNMTVNGNLQTPGVYTMSFTSPGFVETVTGQTMTCTVPGTQQTVSSPGVTNSITVPAFSGNGTVTVAAGTGGTTLTIVNPNYVAPAGCTGGGVISGNDIGLSNPLVTLSTGVNCNISSGGATITAVATATAKLVGSW